MTDALLNGTAATHEHNDHELDTDGALATERAEARIRLDAATRDHAEKLEELNALARQVRHKETQLERLTAELAVLTQQHTTQGVRVAAAKKRVDGAQDELDTISKDRVRMRSASAGGKGKARAKS